MRTRLIALTVILFLLVGIAVSIFMLGPGVLPDIVASQGQASAQQALPAPASGNPIQRENANPGTTTWQILQGKRPL